jgi:predicted dienelactone hydrolase
MKVLFKKLSSIVSMWIVVLALPAAAADGLYKADPGPFEVRIAKDLTLRDPARDKDLPIRVTYPVASGPLPVVVFSHGAWAARDYYVPLATHWASHGYVVVQPTHDDSVTLGQEFGDVVVFSPRFWQARVDDMKFLIDSLDNLGVADLKGRIDRARVGVGGHSYGAGTTTAIGGVTMFGPGGTRRTVGDPRVKAIVVLSGQGLGATLKKDSWKSISIPMQVITGTRDPGRGGQTYEWRIEPFTYAAPGHKYLILIEGADHSFGGVTDTDDGPPRIGIREHPRIPAHVEDVQSATTAFWDAHLLGISGAEAFLATGNMDRVTGGEVTATAK